MSGYLEHVLNVTRTCCHLADKYAELYNDLDPPLNKDVVVAGAALHDIGKLRELETGPGGTEYTAAGNLIGHVLQGRDIVRETAAGREIDPRSTAAAGARDRCAPAAARMGFTKTADDARGTDRPSRRRPRRENANDRLRACRKNPATGSMTTKRNAMNQQFYRGMPKAKEFRN